MKAGADPSQDLIFQGFLREQLGLAKELSAESDLVDLRPIPQDRGLPERYELRLRTRGFVRDPRSGEVTESDSFAVGVYFPPDHLRRPEPFKLITWLHPASIFHPNVRPPFACPGRIARGMSIVEICLQLHEMISYQNVTMREDDALNRDACVWARANQHRFPVDTRPLRRRRVSFELESLRE